MRSGEMFSGRSAHPAAISPPEPRSTAAGYLSAVLAGALLCVPLVCVGTWLAMNNQLIDTPEMQIYYRQLAKIDAAAQVDVLLIGDSTLGNTVDAGAWSGHSGVSVLALPLTGGYGYAGPLNMLRRVMRRHHPRLVIEMQSLDMATRNISWQGLLITAEQLSDIRGLPPWQLVAALARVDLLESALPTLLAGSKAAARLAGHDYWPQGPRDQKREQLLMTRAPTVAEIRPATFEHLRAIGALCQRERIACLYAHGPFLDPRCSQALAYVNAVNARIESSGLRVVPNTPRCMSIEQAGDAADHVRPELKEAFSERYRMLIVAALSADDATRSLVGYLARPPRQTAENGP